MNKDNPYRIYPIRKELDRSLELTGGLFSTKHTIPIVGNSRDILTQHVLIAGRPGTGKSWIVPHLLARLGKIHKEIKRNLPSPFHH